MVFGFSTELRSGERMLMIFRGIEARSDQSLAKVPAVKEEKRKLHMWRQEFNVNLQTKTFFGFYT